MKITIIDRNRIAYYSLSYNLLAAYKYSHLGIIWIDFSLFRCSFEQRFKLNYTRKVNTIIVYLSKLISKTAYELIFRVEKKREKTENDKKPCRKKKYEKMHIESLWECDHRFKPAKQNEKKRPNKTNINKTAIHCLAKHRIDYKAESFR